MERRAQAAAAALEDGDMSISDRGGDAQAGEAIGWYITSCKNRGGDTGSSSSNTRGAHMQWQHKSRGTQAGAAKEQGGGRQQQQYKRRGAQATA